MTGERRLVMGAAMTMPQECFVPVKFSLAKRPTWTNLAGLIYPKTTSPSERSESDVMAAKIKSAVGKGQAGGVFKFLR